MKYIDHTRCWPTFLFLIVAAIVIAYPFLNKHQFIAVIQDGMICVKHEVVYSQNVFLDLP